MQVLNGPAHSSAGGPRRRGHLHFRISHQRPCGAALPGWKWWSGRPL